MKTILVVDDDKLNLTVVSQVLSGTYKVVSIKDGYQALADLAEHTYDVILLDINMPEMDGFELLQRLRKIEGCRNTPVIFLTGSTDVETETRCFKEGAVDFIAKPFQPAVMLSRVGRALEMEELRRSLADRLEQKTQEVSDIKSKAYQDVLTGLWNREYAEEAVNGLIAEGQKGALFMIDMDNFKLINDHYSHLAGDETLKMFADTLRAFSGEEDILCRLGGDEFIVFVKGVTDKRELSGRAAEIILDLCRKIKECRYMTDTSVSIGIARAPEDGATFDRLYHAADQALYFVKKNGKNAYYFFDEKLMGGEAGREPTVDLEYLQEMMSRKDDGRKTYFMDFGSFHHVYNFIRRFVERSEHDVQTLLFTVNGVGDEPPDGEETELALSLLEQAIYDSLRRSDISTRYSSRQLIVILMDANDENGDMVAERILRNFHQLYTGEKVSVEYGIARLESRR